MNARLTGSTLALAGAAALFASPAAAQTWVGMRTTPRLTEIVAVDNTGEPGWLFGSEDVAGDGLMSFKQAEQSVDIRTAYAVTDAARFWARVYVSDPNAVGANIKAFVFVDADRNVATGGTAAAPEIDPKLTADPSPGGYDYVLELRGNATVANVWSWKAPQKMFTATMPTPTQAVGETGKDTDPLQIDGTVHGYFQGSVDLALLGLTQGCLANLFFRSVDETPGGASDLDVGTVASCIPVDTNKDGIPDPVVPPAGCTADNQCPGGGLCVHGVCVIATPCTTNANCKPTEVCAANGNCVAKPGGPCTSDAACVGLVCVGGTCNACTFGGTQCGVGRRCGPSGLCINDTGGSGAAGSGSAGGAGGILLDPGDRVQGGACTCRLASDGDGRHAAAACGLGLTLALGGALRRRRRASRSKGGRAL